MTGATHSGCGSGHCGCGGHDRPGPAASVNGISLGACDERVNAQTLRERAWSELLRQEAVRRGVLPAHADGEAPALSHGDRQLIEAMLDDLVPAPVPTDDECRRVYEACASQFVEGAQVRARHILFAVTPGVDVGRLAARAEQALVELTHGSAPRGRFAALAQELSNCPSGASGGELGWFGPRECADELARELFHGQGRRSLGLRPRLVHSRYGFHILDVLERRPGRQAAFDEVRLGIALELGQQARAKALHQFMRGLAARATIEGVALEAADSPLVQ
jgi:peptidyl-prolyl cis-trans isomerase C